MTGVRMDKWLWAARFFKTRTLAARACELGRIESNGQRAKAAREVRAGDLLLVKNDGGDFHVEVLVLSEMRGPAAVAQAKARCPCFRTISPFVPMSMNSVSFSVWSISVLSTPAVMSAPT